MRILFALALLGTVAMAESQTTPFTLTLNAVEPQVVAGSPVDVEVVMTNTSNHDVSCTSSYSNGLDRNYQYDVRDAEGRPVPQIESKYHGGVSVWKCSLDPGESDNPKGGRISVLYDFSRPGKYTIQVSRGQFGDENRPGTEGTNKAELPVIKSNKITIIVVPAISSDSTRPHRPAERLKIGSEIRRISEQIGGMDDLEIPRQRSEIKGVEFE
jgi:hypothetical protein